MIFNPSCMNEMFPLMTVNVSGSRPQFQPLSPALTLHSLMAVSWAKRVSLNTVRASEAFSAS